MLTQLARVQDLIAKSRSIQPRFVRTVDLALPASSPQGTLIEPLGWATELAFNAVFDELFDPHGYPRLSPLYISVDFDSAAFPCQAQLGIAHPVVAAYLKRLDRSIKALRISKPYPWTCQPMSGLFVTRPMVF